MILFDSHAHLLDERFDEDREAVIASLRHNDIGYVLEAATEFADIPRIRALVTLHDFIYGAAGVHPHFASSVTPAALTSVERAAAEPKFVAVGEIGLDYHYDYAPKDVQKQAFAAQLDIACGAGKPVVIHDREAHGDTVDILRGYKGKLTGVMHCFSGSWETAKECMELGLMVAFGGSATFKNADKLREVARQVPEEFLLMETDCPYMTPEPFRGKRNDPRLMHLTLDMLAGLRGTDREAIARATTQNAKRLFGIMD